MMLERGKLKNKQKIIFKQYSQSKYGIVIKIRRGCNNNNNKDIEIVFISYIYWLILKFF